MASAVASAFGLPVISRRRSPAADSRSPCSRRLPRFILALVAIIMAVTARTPNAFSVGVLAYALTCGMAYAAFSAIVLLAIGRGAASTKYATLSSLGNLPVVYMTASDGWVHDRFGTAWMLHSDALIAIICIVLALAVLRWINPRRRSDLVLP